MQGLVTVVGGTGFVGRYVVRALAQAGWRVRVAARNPAAAPELKVMGAVGQIDFASVNLRDPRRVALAVAGATAVVNLVGVLQESGGQRFEALQREGAATLAQAAAAAGVKRFVQVSAIGADATSASTYARTKAEGEAAVRAAFPTATILRPSIVFGPEDDFFNRFGAMAMISPALPLIGGGLTRFQPVYVGDVGAAVAAALGREDAPGRTYELGGPAVETFRALLQLLLDETGRRRALVPLPFPLAKLMGKAGELVAMLGLKAPITADQVELLKRDNVADPALPGLRELGVEPTALEAVLPTYLWTFRSGGQFAQPGGSNAADPEGAPHRPEARSGLPQAEARHDG